MGSIDMDFMNLNQAAHGVREFGYVLSRLRLRGRRSAATSRPAKSPADRVMGPGRTRGGRALELKLARFGDNMRDVAVTEGDKVEAEIRFGISVKS